MASGSSKSERSFKISGSAPKFSKASLSHRNCTNLANECTLLVIVNHRQVNVPVGPLPQVKFPQGNSRLMSRFSLIVIKSLIHICPKRIRINHKQGNAPVGPLPRVRFTQGNNRLMTTFLLIVILSLIYICKINY